MQTIRFVLKRLVAQRLLALAMIVTLGFSVGVLVAGPVYASASGEAILSSEVHGADVTVKNVRVTKFAGAGFDYGAADAQLQRAASRFPLRDVRREATSTVRLIAGTNQVSAPVLFRDGGLEQVGPIRGRAPTGPDEVLLHRDMAAALGLRIGDGVVAAGAGEVRVVLTLTGTYRRPPHPESDFWYGSQSPFPAPESTEPVPALLTPQGYVQLSTRLGLTSRWVWDLYLDLTRTRSAEAQRIPAGLQRALTFGGDTPLAGAQTQTAIPELLDRVAERTENLRVPVYLVVFQIGAVALAVLAGVASLALSRQSFELAVLRSRGFTRGKLMAAQAVQVVVTAALGYPLGLAIGAGLARLATHANGPAPPGTRYPIELSTAALVAGAIGAVAAAVILLLLSIPVIRRTIIEERRNLSRETRPLLSRVPVELFVFPLGAAAFYEVTQRGVQPNDKGSLDPLIVFAPTLLIFGASFLALRILLWLLRGLEGPIGKTRSLATYLAGRRLGRSPGTSFAISLLLLLTFGLLVVSTSYRATVLRNHEDAARQKVGADYNVVVTPPENPLLDIAKLPPDTTPVIRTELDIDETFALGQPTAIGIDPATYGRGGWWRSDYSSLSEDAILSALRAPDPGVRLPAGTRELRVRYSAELSAGRGSRGLTAAVVTMAPDGSVTSHDLGPLTQDEREATVDVAGARSLLSLVIEQPGTESPEHIVLDAEVDAVADGTARPVPLSTWESLTWRGASGETTARDQGVRAEIEPGVGHVVGGVAPPQPPIPVLTSPGVASAGREFEATVGGQLFRFHSIGTATAFPSFPSEQAQFMVMPLRTILIDTLRVPETGINVNQVWAMGDDPREALKRAGFHVLRAGDAPTQVALLSQQPQSLAVGMHFTAAAGGMALVILGVCVGLYFTQRRREFEFASLRAMGSRPRQIMAVLVSEQALLIGFAVLAGLSLGYAVLRLMMPYFGKSLGVSFPLPILIVDWSALGTYGVAIAVATMLGMVLAIRALLASSVTSVLRGEAE